MKLRTDHKNFLSKLSQNTTSQDTHHGKVYIVDTDKGKFAVLRQPLYNWRSEVPMEKQRKSKNKSYNLYIGDFPTWTFWDGTKQDLPVWRIAPSAQIALLKIPLKSEFKKN